MTSPLALSGKHLVEQFLHCHIQDEATHDKGKSADFSISALIRP